MNMCFGIARGFKQLGLPRPAAPDDLEKAKFTGRKRRVTAIPHDWTFEQVEDFI